MIEFIIYDEEEKYLKVYKQIIEKVMINYDFEYKVTITNNNQELFNQENFKVFILNIKTNDKKGINLAKKIREQKNDWQSMIILISKSLNKKQELVDARLMLIDYIIKSDNYEKRFQEAIKISLKNYDSRPNKLKYSYKNTIYNIEFQRIIYIEKEQDNKRCLIKTGLKEFYFPGNLAKIEKILDQRFIKCNKSYVINIEQVECYNIKDNIITFKNGYQINSISRNKRKELIEHLRGLK